MCHVVIHDSASMYILNCQIFYAPCLGNWLKFFKNSQSVTRADINCVVPDVAAKNYKCSLFVVKIVD